ncbi:hypothetical protein Vqi01_41720 [Micromonospora qiuiae]|uniref:MobA-like NTP transferase domain-containing protein n=2 Tax=Micromonospora qiuiae TaxID=502268 RepID=A0ABQ4JHT0_9ACTN|nr:hypothetical protein Vqi01_41720 [Micromonospora qiuiae]
MGGRDKPGLPVGGVPMRERVLAEVADASPRILVGPGPAPAGVRLTREVPPGGGPVAAIAAGLALLDADVPAVALLAADLPLLTRSAVGELLRRLDEPPVGELLRRLDDRPVGGLLRRLDEPPADVLGTVDGVCFVDGVGRRQTLCGVWRPDALRTAVHQLAARRGVERRGVERRGVEVAARRCGEIVVGQGYQPVDPRAAEPVDPRAAEPLAPQAVEPVDLLGSGLAGASLRELLGGLAVREVTWSGGGPPPWFDCDTERDVRQAEEWMR